MTEGSFKVQSSMFKVIKPKDTDSACSDIIPRGVEDAEFGRRWRFVFGTENFEFLNIEP